MDGSGGYAGVALFADALPHMRRPGFDPASLLADANSHAAFDPLGDLVVTGPTETSMKNLRVVLADPAGNCDKAKIQDLTLQA
ncbi:MAG: hypothetical protein IOC35_07560 [Methylobacterium sp.]|nr:hypothetical protein [Methylobacterium sp.]